MEIALVIIGVLVLTFVVMYNGLIRKKNNVENASSTIDTMLKKRYDLIPNLVASVQTYMTHERDVLNNITALRTQAITPSLNEKDKLNINNEISKNIKSIMVSVENYPNLKANTNFLQLQGSLNEVEEQLSAARRTYNANVTEYNNAIEMFPSSVIASLMGYQRKQVFEASTEERQNVNVKQLFNS